MVIDICGQRDVDLNSARTQIIFGESWIDFEETLARMTCESIRDQVEPEYWEKLQALLEKKSPSDIFSKVIKEIGERNIDGVGFNRKAIEPNS